MPIPEVKVLMTSGGRGTVPETAIAGDNHATMSAMLNTIIRSNADKALCVALNICLLPKITALRNILLSIKHFFLIFSATLALQDHD